MRCTYTQLLSDHHGLSHRLPSPRSVSREISQPPVFLRPFSKLFAQQNRLLGIFLPKEECNWSCVLTKEKEITHKHLLELDERQRTVMAAKTNEYVSNILGHSCYFVREKTSRL